jgi:hypothetical protein
MPAVICADYDLDAPGAAFPAFPLRLAKVADVASCVWGRVVEVGRLSGIVFTVRDLPVAGRGVVSVDATRQ